MKVSLITKDEIKELRNSIDCIDNNRTIELVKKLHGSYNAIFTNYKQKILEDRRANLLETQLKEANEKLKKKDNKIQSLNKKNREEIAESIKNYKKWQEAETKIKILEKKLEKVGAK